MRDVRFLFASYPSPFHCPIDVGDPFSRIRRRGLKVDQIEFSYARLDHLRGDLNFLAEILFRAKPHVQGREVGIC